MAHVVFVEKSGVARALKLAAASVLPGATLAVLPLPPADACGLQCPLRWPGDKGVSTGAGVDSLYT